MTTTEDKAREILAQLFNPEPHPMQAEWSDGHSMSMEALVSRLSDALRSARKEALEEAARVAEGFSETTGPVAVCMTAANRIRSLKREDQASDSPATTG